MSFIFLQRGSTSRGGGIDALDGNGSAASGARSGDRYGPPDCRSIARRNQRGTLRGGSRITGEKVRWGVGTFVTDQLPSIVKGRTADVNVPLPLQWIEPHWTQLTDEETTIAADDVVAAALGIPPGENVCRRRRTYGISGRILAVADKTAGADSLDTL